MRFSLTLLSFLLTGLCYGQYDSILHKSFIEKRPFLSNFYRKILKIHDATFPGKQAVIDELKTFGQQHNDESLITEAALAQAWLQLLESPKRKLETTLMREFIATSLRKKDYISAARACRMLAESYWRIGENYQLAFENYFKNIETGKLLPEDIYPEKMADYASIGAAYYSFKEYSKAFFYLKQGLTYKPPAPLAPIQSDIRNTIGLCYQKTGNLDSSDYFFEQVLQNETQRHEEWRGIAMGNLGYNQYLRGNYAKAIPLLEQDIAIAAKYGSPEFGNKSIIWLANIYLNQQNITKAEQMTMLAKQYTESKNLFDHYQFLYPLLSKLYSAKGDFKKGQQYLDSTLWAKDSVERKFSAMQLARAQQKVESEQQQQELAKLEQEKKNKILQRNVMIGFLVLASALALYIYRLIKRRHQQEQLVKDLTLEKKEQELLAAEQQLKDFALHFQDKSKLLEQLEAQLQSKGSEDEKLLEQLQQTTLLTDEQWAGFRQVFDKVHSGYLVRLKEKLPDLSPAEIRYMALAKLQFSNKEMATALGISQQTVRVTAHRLRKKLHLPEEGSLAGLVDSI